MSNQPDPSTAAAEEIDLGRYLAALVRRRRFVAAAALSGILIALLFTYTAPRLYESEVLLQIPTMGRAAPQPIQPGEESETVFARTAAAIELISSLDFIQRAAEDAGVSERPQALRSMMKLEPVRDARMVRLRVRYHTPEQAQALARAMGERFLAVAGGSVAERRVIISERLADLDRQMTQVDLLIALSQDALGRHLAARNDRPDGLAMSFALNAASIAQNIRESLARTRTELRTELLQLNPPAVVSGPTRATSPISPSPLPNVLLGMLVGLAAGSVLTLSLDALQSSAADRLPAAPGRLASPQPSRQTETGK